MNPRPVTLSGPFVRLVPLTLHHVPALARVGLDPVLWCWIPTPVTSIDEMRADVASALEDEARAAIGCIGALQEGIFRKHLVTASGRVRDTVYFSIIDTEWPAVRRTLDERLAHHATPPQA